MADLSSLTDEELDLLERGVSTGDWSGVSDDQLSMFEEISKGFSYGAPSALRIPEPTPPEPGFWNQFWGSLEQGTFEQNPAMLSRSLEVGGRLVGSEGIASLGQRTAEGFEKEMDFVPAVPSYTDVETLGDVLPYAGSLLGQGISSIAPVAVGAGGGFLAAGPVGAIVGGGLAAAGLNVGDTYSMLLEEGVEPDRAAKIAAPVGALMSIPDYIGAFRTFAPAKQEAARGVLRRFATEAVKRGTIEGGTEAIQSTMQQVATALATGDTDFDRRMEQVINETFAGFLTGGVLGGPAGIMPQGPSKEDREKRKTAQLASKLGRQGAALEAAARASVEGVGIVTPEGQVVGPDFRPTEVRQAELRPRITGQTMPEGVPQTFGRESTPGPEVPAPRPLTSVAIEDVPPEVASLITADRIKKKSRNINARVTRAYANKLLGKEAASKIFDSISILSDRASGVLPIPEVETFEGIVGTVDEADLGNADAKIREVGRVNLQQLRDLLGERVGGPNDPPANVRTIKDDKKRGKAEEAFRESRLQALVRAMLLRGQIRDNTGEALRAARENRPINLDQIDLRPDTYIGSPREREQNLPEGTSREFTVTPVVSEARGADARWMFEIDGNVSPQSYDSEKQARSAAKSAAERRSGEGVSKPRVFKALPRMAIVETARDADGNIAGRAIREAYMPREGATMEEISRGPDGDIFPPSIDRALNKETGEIIGSRAFNTIEEARAAIVPYAPDAALTTVDAAQAQDQRVIDAQNTAKELLKDLSKVLKGIDPNGKIALKIQNAIIRTVQNKNTGEKQAIFVEGVETSGDVGPIITLAFDIGGFKPGDFKAQKSAVAAVLRHEVIHALRSLDLFTPSEWKTLVAAAGKRKSRHGVDFLTWAQENYKGMGLANEAIAEEAVAEMFREWAGKPSVVSGKPASLLRRIVTFLNQLGKYLVGKGWKNAEDIMRSVSAGDVGSRQSGVSRMGPRGSLQEQRLSLSRIANDPGFKRWFRGSAVRDTEGEPRMVYHATHNPNLTEFDTSGFNAHFGGHPQQANERARDSAKGRGRYELTDSVPGRIDLDASVIPAFLKIKNPLRLRDVGAWHNSLNVISELTAAARIGGRAGNRLGKFDLDALEEMYDEASQIAESYEGAEIPDYAAEDQGRFSPDANAWTLSPENAEFLDELRFMVESLGYDGIVYTNAVEGRGLRMEDAEAYIAFYPSQIKSAFNTGAWSDDNPDIRFSFGGMNAMLRQSQIDRLSDAMNRFNTLFASSPSDTEVMRANEEIYRDTGWFIGPDLKPRFEIRDDHAKINLTYDDIINIGMSGDIGGVTTGLKLPDILQHGLLYEAYPWLKDVRIEGEPPPGSRGSAMVLGDVIADGGIPTKDTILRLDLNADDLLKMDEDKNTKEIKKLLLHEVQHLIQYIEGFARGGSPREFSLYNEDGTLQYSYTEDDLRHRREYLSRFEDLGIYPIKDIITELYDDRGAVDGWEVTPSSFKRAVAARKQSGMPDLESWAKYKANPSGGLSYVISPKDIGATQEEIDKVPEFSDATFDSVHNIDVALSRIRYLTDDTDIQELLYRALAGEVEARLVEKRMELDASTRRRMSPLPTRLRSRVMSRRGEKIRARKVKPSILYDEMLVLRQTEPFLPRGEVINKPTLSASREEVLSVIPDGVKTRIFLDATDQIDPASIIRNESVPEPVRKRIEFDNTPRERYSIGGMNMSRRDFLRGIGAAAGTAVTPKGAAKAIAPDRMMRVKDAYMALTRAIWDWEFDFMGEFDEELASADPDAVTQLWWDEDGKTHARLMTEKELVEREATPEVIAAARQLRSLMSDDEFDAAIGRLNKLSSKEQKFWDGYDKFEFEVDPEASVRMVKSQPVPDYYEAFVNEGEIDRFDDAAQKWASEIIDLDRKRWLREEGIKEERAKKASRETPVGRPESTDDFISDTAYPPGTYGEEHFSLRHGMKAVYSRLVRGDSEHDIGLAIEKGVSNKHPQFERMKLWQLRNAPDTTDWKPSAQWSAYGDREERFSLFYGMPGGPALEVVPVVDAETIAKISGRNDVTPTSTQIRSDLRHWAHLLFGRHEGETWRQALRRNLINRFGAAFDVDAKLAGVRGLEGNVYELGADSIGVALENAMQMSGRMEAAIDFGPLSFNRETNEIEIVPDVGGIRDIFKPIGQKNKHYYQGYAVARRERTLRQNNPGKKFFSGLSDAEIDSVIRNAPPTFEEVFNRWQEYNGHMLKFMVDTGALSAEKAQEFANADHIPYYQLFEEDNQTNPEFVIGPKIASGVNNPNSALNKKLREDRERNLGDFYENITRNVQSLISAALKNHALEVASKTIDELTANGVTDVGRPIRTPAERAQSKHTMKFRRDGRTVEYEIMDGALWAAIGAMRPIHRHALIEFASKFASVLRTGITLNPAFMIANLIRGKISAYVISGAPLNPWTTIDGAFDAFRNNEDTLKIKLNTGIGGYTYGMGDTQYYKKLAIDQRLEEGGPSLLQLSKDLMVALKHKGERAGEVSEMAERVALYKKLKRDGVNPVRAAYEASNLINFSRRGAGEGWLGAGLAGLIPMVPFLNARIQGLYRLVENQKGEKRIPIAPGVGLPVGVAVRGSVVTLASLLLYAMGKDDDRWDDEPVHRKIGYDIIYLGDKTVYVPRAFEVGSIFASIPILALDAIRLKESDQLVDGLLGIWFNTFAFNPIPQAMLPALEVASGHNFYTGFPIESLRQTNLPPSDRYNERTSEIAKSLGGITGDSAILQAVGLNFSPIEIDHLVTGYLGGLAASFLALTDGVAQSAGWAPQRPGGVFGDPHEATGLLATAMGIGRFAKEEHEKASRMGAAFYDFKIKASQMAAAMQSAIDRGNFDRALSIMKDHGAPLAARKSLERVGRSISEINSRLEQVYLNSRMSSQDKKNLVTMLKAQRRLLYGRGHEIGRVYNL